MEDRLGRIVADGLKEFADKAEHANQRPNPDTKEQCFLNVCQDCGESNGAGIVSKKHPIESYKNDPYHPTNNECLWCGKGRVVMEF